MVNRNPWGCCELKTQAVGLFNWGQKSVQRPSNFLLTVKNLIVGWWSKVVESGNDVGSPGAKLLVSGAPVEFKADSPNNSPKASEDKELATFLTSSLAAAVAAHVRKAPKRGRNHVSRQSPNPRGRKRAAQGARGIQARNRRKVQHAILHNECGRQKCPDLSLRGMGAHRAEAGWAFHLQPHQEEVLDPHQLLGTGGGNGQPGTASAAAVAARLGAVEGRGSGNGLPEPVGSKEHGRRAPGSGRSLHRRG